MSGTFTLPRRSFPIIVMSGLVSLLRWLILIAIVLLLAPHALAYFDKPHGYAVTDYALRQRDQLLQFVGPKLREQIPTKIAGKDRTDWILVAGLAVVAVGVGSMRSHITSRATARQMRRQLQRWKESMQLDEGTQAAVALDKGFKSFENAKSVDRNELLRAFAEAKKKLDAFGREVAFLSIDVVGSTAMKEREENAAIQYDFAEYRKMVEAVFDTHGILKTAWTPDGVMACFPTIDQAVLAGKDVILALEAFNRNVKLMKEDFSVRCGVNAGYVHFDESTPLAAMSDRVIDIAGHMQKYAEPNSVAVARKVIEPLRNPEGFEPTDKVVDGYEVAHWTPGKA
ncbi:MAG: guanylate cyclase [Proteobacteria bacterium]|nr:guanylate cyclase [Pseudomonadota bacterium]